MSRRSRIFGSTVARTFYRPVAAIGDAGVVSLSFWCAYLARFRWEWVKNLIPVTKGIPLFWDYLPFLPAAIVLWLLTLGFQGAYRRINITLLDEIIRSAKVATISTLLVMGATFLYRGGTDLSRLTVCLFGLWAGTLLFSWRELLKIARTRLIGRQPRRVLIVGNGRLASALERVLLRHKDSAILKRRADAPQSLLRSIERSRIHEVLVADPDMSHKQAAALAAACEERRVPCRIVPDILEIRMGEVVIDDSLGIPTFQLKPLSLRGNTFTAKRIFDCVVAGSLLLILGLPLLLVSLLIRLDAPGPVLFKQPRMGYRGKEFSFYKFRTMVVGAEGMLADLKKQSERAGPVFKMREDPRVTRVGRFLRRYSLDEIPQLLNVLKGDMSLVGPRPQVLWEAKAYDEWAKKRLNILPGITGLWQVSGRANLTYEEMIELDLYYLEHWSPGLDLKILLRTIPTVLGGHGAY